MDCNFVEVILKITDSVDWSAWVTAVATLVLAFLTFVYVRLTKRILENQSNPCVVLTVVHDNDRPSVLQLVAKNVGTGFAHDVSFKFSRPLPCKAWGLTKETADKNSGIMEDGPLIHGIPALGPGEERRVDWGQFGGLLKALGDEPIEAKCMFKKNGRIMPAVTSYLEVKSFDGTNASERPTAKSANELEKIRKDINKLITGYSKLKVSVVDLPQNESDKSDS